MKKEPYKIKCTFNGTVADYSVEIKYHQVQTEYRSSPVLDLFPHIFTVDDIYQYKETCEVFLDDPKTEGDNIDFFSKKAIRNLLHANFEYIPED